MQVSVFLFKGIMDMKCRENRRLETKRMRFRHFGRIRNIKEYSSEDKNKKKGSLQAEETEHSPSYSFLTATRRVFLWIQEKGRRWKKQGSLTVEAAVVLPVFLLTASCILEVIDIYRVQALVKTSLHQSAMELGMYAYAGSKGESSPAGIVSSALCAAYAGKRMPDFGKYVKVSTVGSCYKDGEIDLIANIEYHLPLSVIPLPAIRLKNESRVSAWTGRNAGRQTGEQIQWEEMVYITENESVYHTSSACTHINLAIHQGSLDSVNDLRNTYGQKYHSCEKCGSPSNGGTVYYTEKGNRYHSSADCSGLKRTVRLVKKSEVSGLSQCTRCKSGRAS